MSKPLLIIDGHLDMAFNALYKRRDLTLPVQILREREDPIRRNVSQHQDSLERRSGPWTQKPATVAVSLPEIRKRRIGIMLTTIMARVKAITDRGGVIGTVFAEQMLSPVWNWDDPSTHYANSTRPMKAAIEHISLICELTGNTDHVAFGTDLDGGFGQEQSPNDLNTITDLNRLPDILDKGYSSDDIDNILHGNWIRFLKACWQ